MFEKNYEQRLASWHSFRKQLETVDDPFRQVLDLYKLAPSVSINTDPYDQKSWPDPWELIVENLYCDFCRVLGQCYSLQLTERFKEENFEIHISIDSEKSESYYLLYVGDKVLGYRNFYVSIDDIPQTVVAQKVYHMPKLQ